MDAGMVFRRIALRLIEEGRENVVKALIEYLKRDEADENHVALIDAICAEVVRAKPQKPDEFIAFIADDVLKVGFCIVATAAVYLL